MAATEQAIQAHYRTSNLLERILSGLRAAGKNPDAPSVEDLAPADDFHSLGRVATCELAELAEIPAGSKVLDIGSGLGGPARFLASSYDCDVTGLDLMPEFCAVATELSRRTGLADRTHFQQGNALSLPFPDASFDCVWTIQAQMNIADKRTFYAEIARVLRPTGRFVFQDICAGDGRAFDFPVPWASEPTQSHLIAAEALRALLLALPLQERVFRDVSQPMLAWQDANRTPAGDVPPPLGMHLVLGERHADKRANSSHALRDGKIAYVQGLYFK